MPPQIVSSEVRDPREVLEGLDPAGLEPVLIQQPGVVGNLAVGKLQMPPEGAELQLAQRLRIEPLALLQVSQQGVGRLGPEPLLQREPQPVHDGAMHQLRLPAAVRAASTSSPAALSGASPVSSSRTWSGVASQECLRASWAAGA